jgi:hypothetical protein
MSIHVADLQRTRASPTASVRIQLSMVASGIFQNSVIGLEG